MKYFAITVCSFFLSSYAYSIELNGTWKEDVSKTIQWNSTYRNIEDGYLNKLKAIMGHLYISYSNGEMCSYTEPHVVQFKGKSSKRGALFFKSSYEVIAENKFGFVLNSVIDGQQNIDMIVFENDTSIYGLGLTTEDYGQPGLRTYFKKVSGLKEMAKCSE